MTESRMAMPEDYELAKRENARGRLGVNWGMTGVHGGPSSFAEKSGWNLPLFLGLKKAFIKKMLESEANFEAALVYSGIDVYISKDTH